MSISFKVRKHNDDYKLMVVELWIDDQMIDDYVEDNQPSKISEAVAGLVKRHAPVIDIGYDE